MYLTAFFSLAEVQTPAFGLQKSLSWPCSLEYQLYVKGFDETSIATPETYQAATEKMPSYSCSSTMERVSKLETNNLCSEACFCTWQHLHQLTLSL